MGGVELGERNVSLDNIHRVAHAPHVPPAGLFPTSAPRRRAVEVAHQAGPASFAKVGSLPHQNRHRPLRAVTTPVPCWTTPASDSGVGAAAGRVPVNRRTRPQSPLPT